MPHMEENSGGITLKTFRKSAILAACLACSALIHPGLAMAQFVMPGEPDERSLEILAEREAYLGQITPVDDALLQNPPAEDWLNWRRTLDGHADSPLDSITTDNVGGLQLAWSWALNDGPSYAPPLVHDGVMFVYNFGDRVQALDARNGDLLWTYNHQLPDGTVVAGTNFARKSMAIYGENLLTMTSDLRLVGLNMQTGEVAFDVQLADPADQFAYNGALTIANGVAIIGMTGCGAGQAGGCFILGADASTGEEMWRFNTVARPDEPGGETWNDLPLDQRYGGSVWGGATYDPELDLVYIGVGQPYPWNAEVRGTSPAVGGEDGEGNSLLYTNSTLAFHPQTGELAWHYQHVANDSLDMDYAFERTIVDLDVDGETRRLVVTSSKLAIFEALDAETGEFVFARDMGIQNVITDIDPETGAKTFNMDLIAGPGQTTEFCPHAGGARSFPATAYHAETQTLYIPMQEHCARYEPLEVDPEDGYPGAAVSWAVLPYRNADGETQETVGRLEALNLGNLETEWVNRPRSPQSTGVLLTGGGVLFEGSMDRYFTAYAMDSGDLLWETRLGDIPNSFPITYEADGRQYIAVITGGGGPFAATWGGMMPDILLPPQQGSEVYVFALPEPRD